MGSLITLVLVFNRQLPIAGILTVKRYHVSGLDLEIAHRLKRMHHPHVFVAINDLCLVH